MPILIIKNPSMTSAVTINDLDGLTIDPKDSITFTNIDNSKLRESIDIIHQLTRGALIVSNGLADLTPNEAINAIRGTVKPINTSADGKMFVVNSNRPQNFFAYYTSRGDDMVGGVIGMGPKMIFDVPVGSIETKDFFFKHVVLVEEGTVIFTSAELGNSISFEVIAPPGVPFPVKGTGSLDLTATGFVPNGAGTGMFSIDTAKATVVNRHVNQIQLLGDGQVALTTPEPGRIPVGYGARLVLDNTVGVLPLKVVVQMLMFREHTV